MSKKKTNNKKKKKTNQKSNSKINKQEFGLVSQENEKKKSFIPYYLIIIGICTLIFIFMYGFKVLNPTYTDWIFGSSGDIIQHYVGWEAFRWGDWTFPIGLTDTISYPIDISVIYTDAIPIFAVFFKVISFILPIPLYLSISVPVDK